VNRAHGEDRHGPGGKFRHNEAPSVLGDHSRPNGRVDANLHFCRARVHVRRVHRARVEEARSWEKIKIGKKQPEEVIQTHGGAGANNGREGGGVCGDDLTALAYCSRGGGVEEVECELKEMGLGRAGCSK